MLQHESDSFSVCVCGRGGGSFSSWPENRIVSPEDSLTCPVLTVSI